MGLTGMKWESVRPLAISAGVGAIIFSLCFHIEVLNPLNVHWLLQYDWGASFVGWEAYRHDAWRLPLGAERLLDWPSGDNVVFTDSFPVLALIFKILSPALPDPFQYIGLWFLFSVFLQVYFGYRLSRKAGLDGGEAALGAFLMGLTPFFLARIYHNTLFSHWMILWAFEIYGFEPQSRRRNWGFGLLLVLTALTNFYLTAMVAGIVGADLLRTSFRRVKAREGVLATAAATVSPLIIAMAVIGYFGARQSAAGGFGVYASELLAWINPQDPLTSRYLPAMPVSQGAYEGFQYLGLGVICLVLLGLGLQARRAWRRTPRSAEERRFDGVEYLAPVLVTYWAFALSDKVHIGSHLLIDLRYGPWLGPIPAMLRSSGRFMWPVSYGLILAALLAIARMPQRWIKPVLIAGLILQIADLSAFMRQQWIFTATAADPAVFQHLRSPDWDRLISTAKVVDFQPSDPKPRLGLFWELAYRASRRGVPMTDMYSARVAPAQGAFQKADVEDIRKGRLARDRLYVFADGCVPASGAQIYRLDDVLIIPPQNADVSGLTTAPPASIRCRLPAARPAAGP